MCLQIFIRYLRLQGRDVLFVCGSDEHGYFHESQKEGITPQEVIDKYDGIIRKSFSDFGISFDNYSRTSAKIHHDTVNFSQRCIKKVLSNKSPSNCMTQRLISS
jgi:methionyl-tRNA synthetase